MPDFDWRSFFLGLPTIPDITLITQENALTTQVRCSCSSTTLPKDHSWTIRYYFKVNDVDITSLTHGRYVVCDNILTIFHDGKEQPGIRVTCIVHEENSNPRNVSKTVELTSYCKYTYIMPLHVGGGWIFPCCPEISCFVAIPKTQKVDFQCSALPKLALFP